MPIVGLPAANRTLVPNESQKRSSFEFTEGACSARCSHAPVFRDRLFHSGSLPGRSLASCMSGVHSPDWQLPVSSQSRLNGECWGAEQKGCVRHPDQSAGSLRRFRRYSLGETPSQSLETRHKLRRSERPSSKARSSKPISVARSVVSLSARTSREISRKLEPASRSRRWSVATLMPILGAICAKLSSRFPIKRRTSSTADERTLSVPPADESGWKDSSELVSLHQR